MRTITDFTVKGIIYPKLWAIFLFWDHSPQQSKYKPGGPGANGEQVMDIFSIYFCLNFFIFPSLPGREKIRYHSITTCIIQHRRFLPMAPFANTIIRSRRLNLIWVRPTGLHPPVVITVFSCYAFLIWNWARGKDDCVSRTKQMIIWMHGVLCALIMSYKGYTYMYSCRCVGLWVSKSFALICRNK